MDTSSLISLMCFSIWTIVIWDALPCWTGFYSILDILDPPVNHCRVGCVLHLGKTPEFSQIFLIFLNQSFDRVRGLRKSRTPQVLYWRHLTRAFLLTEDDASWLPRTWWRRVVSDVSHLVTVALWYDVVWCDVVWCDPGDHWTGTVDVVSQWVTAQHCYTGAQPAVLTPAGYQQPAQMSGLRE